MSLHLELVDAVNDASTMDERMAAHSYLRGYRQGLADANGSGDVGVGMLIIEADLHSMGKYGEDADMHGGVLIDWKPKAVRSS